jgi:hypothetical protein
LHLFVPDLVPAEPVDAGDDWVAYRLKDGSAWIDGAEPTSRVGAKAGKHRDGL